MQDSLRNKTIKNSIWKFSERIIAQGVSLLVSIILARLLLPDDYGVVSIVTIFFSFMNVIITGGLNSALIQKKDADVEDYSAVLYASLFVSLVFYGLIYFCAPIIASIYRKDVLINVFRVMGLILPVTAVKSVICAYVSSTLQFRKFFFSTIGGTLISAVVGIWLAQSGYGAWALVAQQMTNTIIDTLILQLSTRVKFVMYFNVAKFKKLFSYGSKVLLSSLIDTTYNELNPLIIGVKYSGADLSFYNRGQTFPNVITSTVNSTLSGVLFPVLSKVQDDKERLLNYTRLFIRLSSYLVFPMMLGFVAISDNFISVVLTDKWLPASVYIKIFCISNMFVMIATGNCETIKAMGRSDVFLKMEIIKKTCYFIVIGIFIWLTKSPQALAFAAIVCTAISIIVNTYPNRKLLLYSYKLQAMDIVPNLAISITMMIIVSLLNNLMINKVALITLQIVLGAFVYAFMSVLTHNKSFYYIIDILRTKSVGYKK